MHTPADPAVVDPGACVRDLPLIACNDEVLLRHAADRPQRRSSLTTLLIMLRSLQLHEVVVE